LAFMEILDLNDIHQLLELLDDLIERGVVAVRNDRHARGVVFVRGSNIQRVDVVAAAREKAGHTRQNAKLIFNQDRYGVSHKLKTRVPYWNRGRPVESVQRLRPP